MVKGKPLEVALRDFWGKSDSPVYLQCHLSASIWKQVSEIHYTPNLLFFLRRSVCTPRRWCTYREYKRKLSFLNMVLKRSHFVTLSCLLIIMLHVWQCQQEPIKLTARQAIATKQGTSLLAYWSSMCILQIQKTSMSKEHMRLLCFQNHMKTTKVTAWC